MRISKGKPRERRNVGFISNFLGRVRSPSAPPHFSKIFAYRYGHFTWFFGCMGSDQSKFFYTYTVVTWDL
jgi:hypothetical protein